MEWKFAAHNNKPRARSPLGKINAKGVDSAHYYQARGDNMPEFDDDGKDLPASLLRQRRNLFAVSILLLLLDVGGVTFGKAHVAGFDVEIKNPNALLIFLWAGYCYFLYRYFIYFLAVGPAKIKYLFLEGINRACSKKINSLLHEYADGKPFGISMADYAGVKRNNWRAKGKWKSPKYGDGEDFNTDDFELEIPFHKLRWTWLRAVFKAATTKPELTDYVLPFVLAVAVFGICGFGKWSGSFSAIRAALMA